MRGLNTSTEQWQHGKGGAPRYAVITDHFHCVHWADFCGTPISCPWLPQAAILAAPRKDSSLCNLSRGTSLSSAKRSWSRSKHWESTHFPVNFGGRIRRPC